MQAFTQFLATINVDFNTLLQASNVNPQKQLLRQVMQAHIVYNTQLALPQVAVGNPINAAVQPPASLQTGLRYSAAADSCYSVNPAPAPTCPFPLLTTGLQLYPSADFIVGAAPPQANNVILTINRQVVPGSATVFSVTTNNSTSNLIVTAPASASSNANSLPNIYSGYPTAIAGTTPTQKDAPPNVAHIIDAVIFPDMSYRQVSALDLISAANANQGFVSYYAKALAETKLDLVLSNLQNTTIFVPSDTVSAVLLLWRLILYLLLTSSPVHAGFPSVCQPDNSSGCAWLQCS